jgi:hypothetical protein
VLVETGIAISCADFLCGELNADASGEEYGGSQANGDKTAPPPQDIGNLIELRDLRFSF